MAIPNLFRRKQDNENEQQEPEQLATININIGSGGLLDVESVDKQVKYQRLLSEITTSTLKEIATIFERTQEQSGTKSQAYQLMNDAGIPLEYLIALGLTNEESIYGYQVLSQRGILEGGVSKSKVGKGVDEDYANEVRKLEKPKPRLVSLTGDSIEEMQSLAEMNDQQVEISIEQGTQIRQLELRIKTLQAEFEMAEQRVPTNIEEDYVSGVLGAMEGSRELDLTDLIPEISVNETNHNPADQKEDELRKYLDRLKQKAGEYEPGVGDDDEYLEEVDTVRTVYVLSQEFHIEQVPGYTIKFIESSVDLNFYTNSKHNLLVITNNVPRYILNVFVEWIKGVSTSNKKYRIVTLEGAEMSHPLIEAVVQLTKESLDEYYELNELSKYTGKGVGSFLNIADFFKEDKE